MYFEIAARNGLQTAIYVRLLGAFARPGLKKSQRIMADIFIVIGTESGNAQMVADCLEDEFAAQGHSVTVNDNAQASDVTNGGRDVVLIVTATTGMGDLPSNIEPFARALEGENADLSSLRYGVVALGDQTYQDTFCGAGKKMDALFEKLGAKRIGERLEIDACTQPLPDEEAVKWAAEWVGLL